MKYWCVESNGRWFIVKSRRKRAATKEGVVEYGRGNASVRLATDDEIKSYVAQRGSKAIEEV